MTYHVAQCIWRKAPAHPLGIFVTGTDTGIGKTLCSAILVQAWRADYWKPLQTGTLTDTPDAVTVTQLADLPADRLHPSAYALPQPLAPLDAARLEGLQIDPGRLVLPQSTAPLIVEGAGGLYVPITESMMMIDFMARLGLPVVLVARSTLGTINHSLLSIHALRRQGIPILGVMLSGPPNPGNRHAIETFGQVRVLAEIPWLEQPGPEAIARCARQIPPLETCLQDLKATPGTA